MSEIVDKLLDEIHAGESSRLEFKEQIPSDHLKFLKTAVAFANGRGGKIVFGIRDDGYILGVDAENIFRVMDSITDSIYNSITPTIATEASVQTIQEKSIIVVEILPGNHTPYYIKSLGFEQGCFLRASATTRMAGTDSLKGLILEGSNTSFDQTAQGNTPVSEKEIVALCRAMKKCALENSSGKERKLVKPISITNLESWGLVERRGESYIPSHAFNLLTSNDHWNAKIQCAVFKGKSRDIFVDKREYGGPLQKQIDEAYDFVLRNIHLGATIQGLYRTERYEIPPSAIREIIVNAVVHRNYQDKSCIQVAIFDDRLEITSPGSLVKGMSTERMKEGLSKVRNEGLANAFHYMKLIEQWGTGIPRIFKTVKEYGLREPEIIDMEDALRINIYRGQVEEQAPQPMNDKKIAFLSETPASYNAGGQNASLESEHNPRATILRFMQKGEAYSATQIAAVIGLKASRTRDYLNALISEGIVESQGANKNRTYRLKRP